jgi:hypothetical protein
MIMVTWITFCLITMANGYLKQNRSYCENI